MKCRTAIEMETGVFRGPTSVMVSVIIPIYNGVQHGLKSVLESVIGQSYPNMELILVDDKSEDASKSVISETMIHCQKKAVLIEHGKNLGLAKSWNDGIIGSKGKYILLLQQDCNLESADTIESAIQEINQTESDVLLGTPQYRFDELNFYQKISEIRNSRISVKSAENSDHIYFSANKCDLFRKDVFDKVGVFDERLFSVGEDWLFFLKLMDSEFKVKKSESLQYYNSLKGENTLLKVILKEKKYGMHTVAIYLLRKREGTKSIFSSVLPDNTKRQIRYRILNVIFPLLSLLFIMISFFLETMVLPLLLVVITWGSMNFGKYWAISINNKRLGLSPFKATLISYLLDMSYSIGVMSSLIHRR